MRSIAWIMIALAVPLPSAAQEPAPAAVDDAPQAAVSEPAPAHDDVAEASEGTWQDRCHMDGRAWSGSAVPETPVYARAPDGACFCSVLGARAGHAARRHTFGAWALGTLSAGLVVVGAVLGNDRGGDLWQRERGTLLSVSGVALAPLAYYFFRRSERDGTVAARSTEAQGQASDDDLALFRACAAAKADWVASREASVAFSALSLERFERVATETREHADAARGHAEESRENADAANKASEQAQQSAETAESVSESEDEGDEPVATPKPVRRPLRP